MSAYVEIIFDNSDDRFPTGNKEVILRRTIGLKKDEYSLDRKNATKSDVMNLLESAGFSRSNPYYIVPQGRVTALTNMKDPERLTLLKEISGTHVYETRRAESVRIMNETDAKRGKIDELLSYIRERLSELEEEKDELKAYQEHDRERRCLEYTIYYHQQQKYQEALEQQDEMRTEGVEEADQNRDQFLEGEKALATIDEEIAQIKQQMELLRLDMKQYEEERRQAAREKAQIEMDVNAMTDGQTSAQAARDQFQSDLQEVQDAIAQRELQLSKLTPEYNHLRQEEITLKTQVTEAEGTRQRLYAKQGRSAKYRNKAERDNFLQQQIDDVNMSLASRKAVGMQNNEDIAQLQTHIQRVEEEISELRSRMENRSDNTASLLKDVHAAKEQRNSLQDQRKELWREESRLDSFMANTKSELDKAERNLSHMMDRDTARGLAAVRRYKRQGKMAGAYGTLAELFDVSNRFKTAVEVTAGASLFHYVVDNDRTAQKLVEMLNKDRAGRVTFVPLNQIHPRSGGLPSANDAIPMIEKLKFDPLYTKSFQQVFGKTIICPNLAVASQYARSHGVTAITPDGDRSDKKGALTGGYYDPSKSRLDAVKAVSKWREEFDGQTSRLNEIKRELEAKDQEITRAVSNLQKAEQHRMQAENAYGPIQQDLRAKTDELEAKQDALESKKRSSENISVATNQLNEQLNAFENELAAEFKKALSREEEHTLEIVLSQLPALKKQHLAASSARADLEAQKSMLEVELKTNLRLRLDELKGQELEGGAATTNQGLQSRRKDLKRATNALEAVTKKVREAETALEEQMAAMSQSSSQRAEKQGEQEDLARVIERFQRKMEKSMANRQRLADQATEASKNIRDLGVLPEEAFSKAKRMTADKVRLLLWKLVRIRRLLTVCFRPSIASRKLTPL